MEENKELILRSLDDGWDYQPDWRNRVVEQYVERCIATNDPKLPQVILDAEKDPYVRQAFRHRMGLGAVKAKAIAFAYQTQRENKRTALGSLMKALIVADRRVEEIAAELRISRENVVAYSRIFFDIERFLGVEPWLESLLFQETELHNDAEVLRERRLLSVAFYDGWPGLETALFNRTSPTQESIEKTRIAIQAALGSRALEFARDIQQSGIPASPEDLNRFAMVENMNTHKADDKAPTATAFAKALMGIVLDAEGGEHDSSGDPAITGIPSSVNKLGCGEICRYRRRA
jgi:hypothetical protein